jgi:hypothetical protein
MIKHQQFTFFDKKSLALLVVSQKSTKYTAASIQISKVLDENDANLKKSEAIFPYKWVYEEIKFDGTVSFATFMEEAVIKRDFSWAREM